MQIDKNIPIPADVLEPRTRFNFHLMGVGDSMFREWGNPARSMRVNASIYKKRNPGWNYRTQKVTEKGVIGSRLWRTPDTKPLKKNGRTK